MMPILGPRFPALALAGTLAVVLPATLTACARAAAPRPSAPTVAASVAVSRETGAHSTLPSKLDSIAHEVFDAQHLVGMTVAVGTTRGLSWSRGYGVADLENSVPASPDTVYRFASVSKAITAVAAMELAESGKLDLDAPVQRYVPTFPAKQWPVTARHVLTHTSGIRHFKDDEAESTLHFKDLEAGLDRIRNEPLLHEPGTAYTYSSYAFTLLGRAIEGASGESYVSYVRGHVFQPAGMTASRDDDLRAIVPHRAQGYARTPDGALENSVLTDTSSKIPSGGLAGTAKDLVAFGLATLSGRILHRETFEKMIVVSKVGSPPMPNPDGFGLGVMIEDMDGRRAVFHTGAQPRAAAILYLLADDGVAIAILSNLEGTVLHPAARALAKAVLAAKE
jgi:serine beta-lactamase-like protein LACTB